MLQRFVIAESFISESQRNSSDINRSYFTNTINMFSWFFVKASYSQFARRIWNPINNNVAKEELQWSKRSVWATILGYLKNVGGSFL